MTPPDPSPVEVMAPVTISFRVSSLNHLPTYGIESLMGLVFFSFRSEVFFPPELSPTYNLRLE